MNTSLWYILILFIIILIIFYYINQQHEKFTNANDNYLYPITGLTDICKKQNLIPSYMPKACYMNGDMNTYANCKCEDQEGNCKICYHAIKNDSNNSSVIYNAESAE